jgi:hypothetical protein
MKNKTILMQRLNTQERRFFMRNFCGAFAAFLMVALAYCVSSPVASIQGDCVPDTVAVYDTICDTLRGSTNMICSDSFSRSKYNPLTKMWTLTGFYNTGNRYEVKVLDNDGEWVAPAAMMAGFVGSAFNGIYEIRLIDNFDSLANSIWRVFVYQ